MGSVFLLLITLPVVARSESRAELDTENFIRCFLSFIFCYMDCLFQYCQFVERRRDHLAHEGFVVRIDVLGDALGDDGADRGGAAFQNLFFSSRLSMLLSSQRLYRPPKPEVIHPLEGHSQITLMFPMLAVLYVFPAAAAAFFVPRFRSMHARKNLPVKSSFMENAAIPRCPNKLRQPGTDGISK